jgi:hypothetical protein
MLVVTHDLLVRGEARRRKSDRLVKRLRGPLTILIRMLKDDDDDGMDLSYYAIEARGGGGEEEEEAGEAGEAPVSTGKDAGEQGRAVAEDGEGNGYTARLVTAAYLFVLSDLNHLLVRHVVFTAGSGSWRRSEMG